MDRLSVSHTEAAQVPVDPKSVNLGSRRGRQALHDEALHQGPDGPVLESDHRHARVVALHLREALACTQSAYAVYLPEEHAHLLEIVYTPRHHDAPGSHLGVQEPAPVSQEVLGQVGLTGDLD